MNTIFVLLALAAFANADIQWSSLHMKWSISDDWDNDSWYEIPFNESTAKDQSWVKAEGVSSIPAVSTYCMDNDPRVCMYFDSYGNPSGFQIGVLVSDFEGSGSPYNFSAIPTYTVKTIFDQETLTSEVYTVDPDILAAGGRADAEGVLGTEGVWIRNGDDSYLEVPRDAAGLVEAGFVKENCIPKMGTHYYYNMSSSLDCQDFFPWFFICNNEGEVHGIGFQSFGIAIPGNRSWYETILPVFLTYAINEYPTCLSEWSEQYGVISMHTYFTPEPWNITCS